MIASVADNVPVTVSCGTTEDTAPVAPVAPVLPMAPVDPVAPVTPVGPVDPVAPVTPVLPVAPVAPVAPAMPVIPITEPLITKSTTDKLLTQRSSMQFSTTRSLTVNAPLTVASTTDKLSNDKVPVIVKFSISAFSAERMPSTTTSSLNVADLPTFRWPSMVIPCFVLMCLSNCDLLLTCNDLLT